MLFGVALTSFRAVFLGVSLAIGAGTSDKSGGCWIDLPARGHKNWFFGMICFDISCSAWFKRFPFRITPRKRSSFSVRSLVKLCNMLFFNMEKKSGKFHSVRFLMISFPWNRLFMLLLGWQLQKSTWKKINSAQADGPEARSWSI